MEEEKVVYMHLWTKLARQHRDFQCQRNLQLFRLLSVVDKIQTKEYEELAITCLLAVLKILGLWHQVQP